MTEADYPLVSIIIPTYNSRAWVCDAIDSALAQTYPACEIIVIDDGSVDGTGGLLAEKYRGQIRYYYQANFGLAAARNRGLSLAAGEYVQFLDADDILLPQKLVVHVQCLEGAPQFSVAYSDFSYFSDEGPDVWISPPASDFRDRYRSGNIWSSLLEGNFLVCHAALSRLAAVQAVGGFDEAFGTCADYDLWLRMAHQGYRFAYTGPVLVLYRRTAGSMSSHAIRQRLETIRVVEKIRTYASLGGLDEQARHRHYLARLHLQAGELFLLEADVAKALSHSLQATRYERAPVVAWMILRMACSGLQRRWKRARAV